MIKKVVALLCLSCLFAVPPMVVDHLWLSAALGLPVAYFRLILIAGYLTSSCALTLFLLKNCKTISDNEKYLQSFLKHMSRLGFGESKSFDCKPADTAAQISVENIDVTSAMERNLKNLVREAQYLDSIVCGISHGVAAFDRFGVATFVNLFFADVLGLKPMQIIGSTAQQLQSATGFPFDLRTGTHGCEISFKDRHYKMTVSHIAGVEAADECAVVLSDVTEEKKYELLRSEFVSNVTHELKTPLTSIQGFADTLLAEQSMNPQTVRHFLNIIHVEAIRLCGLINDILLLQRLESITSESDISVFPAMAPVRSAVDVCRFTAQNRRVMLKVEECCDCADMSANFETIKRLLINLISNSIAYNKDFGIVKVSARTDGPNVIYRVSDTGIGIKPENIEHIFERFYRTDRGRSRSKGGTGLGLSIVKHIVSLYNGEISVDSEFGKWTSVTVTLPIAADDSL